MKANKEVGLVDLVVVRKSRIQAWATGLMVVPSAEGRNWSGLLIAFTL